MASASLRSLAFVVGVALFPIAERGGAQDDEDTRQIRQVVGVYFRGHATANADTMRSAFLPTAHIEG